MYYLAIILICISIVGISKKVADVIKAKGNLITWIKEQKTQYNELESYYSKAGKKFSNGALIFAIVIKALVDICILILAYKGACTL